MIGSKQARDLAESSFKKKERRLKEGEQVYSEYLAEQRRTDEKTVRLRALRLARDARDDGTKAPVRKSRAR